MAKTKKELEDIIAQQEQIIETLHTAFSLL